ncbi:MAG: LamG domain-containing protein, partial [Alphaproteobacteria bacterium]|nr:LamG domain-containing protein [Alphaproteobacteria bacterium]
MRMASYLNITGYSDKISVAPGETIAFMVSCDGVREYRADVVRVVHGDENPAGPGLREVVIRTPVNRTYNGRRQAIHMGSSVLVPAHPVLDGLDSFTVQCMVWPTTPKKGEQCLIARWNARTKAGFQLLIDGSGAVALRIGDGKGKAQIVSAGKPLLQREWCLVGASYDPAAKRITVYQDPQRTYARVDTGARVRAAATVRCVPGAGPLVFAAYCERLVGERAITAGHFNGKIDSPRLSSRALKRSEMEQLLRAPIPSKLVESLVGCWDFAREIPTTRVIDLSAHGLHGEIVNLPARAMTGYNWTGAEPKWSNAPEQYGAIHFHDDDIYDAQWDADFTLTIPRGMKSGCYAARLRGGGHEEYIPFYVRAPLAKPTAKILYLAPTASYMAYANLSFAMTAQAAEMLTGRLVIVADWERHLNENPELGASLYDYHSDGSGI